MMKLLKHINRKPERKIKEMPDVPLSQEEADYLTKKYLSEMMKFYEEKAIDFGAGDDVEIENNGQKGELRNNDLQQDGVLLFLRTLKKFDKSKCGEISDRNVEGATNQKTLDWYFMVYARSEVFFSLGMVYSENEEIIVNPKEVSFNIDSNDDVSSNVESEESFASLIHQVLTRSDNIESAKIKYIAKELNGNTELVRFFFLKYYYNHTMPELKLEYGKSNTELFNGICTRIMSSTKKFSA